MVLMGILTPEILEDRREIFNFHHRFGTQSYDQFEFASEGGMYILVLTILLGNRDLKNEEGAPKGRLTALDRSTIA